MARQRVFICGMDGYIGWALYWHLKEAGYEVTGIDNRLRRANVDEIGSDSAIPIDNDERWGVIVQMDLTDLEEVTWILRDFKPDVVVHLAQQPSAPFSMIDCDHAVSTHRNNVEGNLVLLHVMRDVCPDAHLVKLGTLGEYGTPDCEIPEGDFEVEFRGRTVTLPFPRQAGSWYHQTKVHDTHNVRFACKIWGLRATDIMQGVVYGTHIEAMKADPFRRTRFDFDECFGTALNRFCAQGVIGMPLTVYGRGGQTRGYLPLRDSVRCIQLIIENPPDLGEYRTVNQFANAYSVNALAKAVSSMSGGVVERLDNPRVEMEHHFYQPECRKLASWGYTPTANLEKDVAQMLAALDPHRDRIERHKNAILPKTRWRP
jgi:UDP-sulfoquinovose synthase